VYDQISIVTPEGITLALPLAGVGSRFIAALIDTSIQFAALLGLSLLRAGLPDNGVVSAVFIVVAFVLFTGYDISFETLASGRTPGKRVTGLRVVTAAGAPVRFTTSAIRNVLRVVDILPGTYLIGIVTIVLTTRNQRLGDLAAGTLVVRERTGADSRPSGPWTVVPGSDPGDDVDPFEGWDVTAVTGDEVATVRRFLERRTSLVPDARARLAAELAGRLRPKVAAPETDVPDETFLMRVVGAKGRQR
jgi:uncharacterized RDD family membrane protein YckC